MQTRLRAIGAPTKHDTERSLMRRLLKWTFMAVMFKVILSERIHLWKYEDRLKDFLEESEMMAPGKDGKQIALDCPRLKCTVEEFITGQTSTRDFTKADLEEKNYLFLIENETSEEKIIKRLSQVKVVIAI